MTFAILQETVPALLVDRVSKSYLKRSLLTRLQGATGKVEAQALREISFSVREGETVGLLGPNGAGKTTLMKIVATMLHPSAGRVLIHGHDIVENPLGIRGQVGLINSDERSFYWRLTGRQNLDFFATLYGLPKHAVAGRVEELLDNLGLAFAADRPFHGYSSGMKQKMAVARGLLNDPKLILYDEPTRSLDPLSAQNIHNWLLAKRERSPRTTHLIATNQLREAEKLCDRVLIMNHGVVIASGTITEIRSQFQQCAVHRISCRGLALNLQLRPVPEIGLMEISRESGDLDTTVLTLRTTDNSEALSNVLDTILRSGAIVLKCQTEELPFDEVFCSLVLEDQNRSRVQSVQAGAL